VNDTGPRFAGVELYFKDLAAARRFYSEALGLTPDEERPEHRVKFSLGDGFLWYAQVRHDGQANAC
jgi:catechol 2,3-dioxygenase-like lactoylglutathione lyase family enzyme